MGLVVWFCALGAASAKEGAIISKAIMVATNV